MTFNIKTLSALVSLAAFGAACIVVPPPDTDTGPTRSGRGGDDFDDGGGGGGGGGGGSGGGDTGGGGGGGGPDHGSLCLDNDDCGFPSSGLLCIFENSGDNQGVCRVVCSGFSDCLGNDDYELGFDTDCCDVTNGTRVCASSFDYPNATCN